MKKSNLIVLRYCLNECYVEALTIPVLRIDKQVKRSFPDKDFYESFDVDIDKRKWTFNGQTHRIGRGTIYDRFSYHIIGVYDRINVRHLNNMLRDSEEARHRHTFCT